MEPLLSINTVLDAISKAITIAKSVKNSGVPIETNVVKLKFADVIDKLVDAKEEMTNIKDKLREKDDLIHDLKQQNSMKGKTQYKEPFYWVVDEYEDNEDGPYCQACYDKDNKYIRVQKNSDNWWECKCCKNKYTDKPASERTISVQIVQKEEVY